jgi:CBS domain-containing protein
MQVREIMTEHLAHCAPDASLKDVANMMVSSDCGAIPVLDPKTHRPVGIVTDRDIVCRSIAKGQNPLDMKANDVMTLSLAAVTPDTSLEDCLSKMESAQIRRMLVVGKDGEVCGVVSQADIARQAPEFKTAELIKDVSKPSQQSSKLH